MERRVNFVNLVIGRRGSGKTTFVREGLLSYPQKVLIVDTFDHPTYRDIQAIKPERLKYWKSGMVRVFGSDFDLIMQNILLYCRNCLIVFEDSTKYIRNHLPNHIRTFLIDTKQLNVDVIFFFHGLGMVMPDLYRLADTITLFKVGENIKRYSDKIPNYGEVERAFNQIQQAKNPYENRTIFTN